MRRRLRTPGAFFVWGGGLPLASAPPWIRRREPALPPLRGCTPDPGGGLGPHWRAALHSRETPPGSPVTLTRPRALVPGPWIPAPRGTAASGPPTRFGSIGLHRPMALLAALHERDPPGDPRHCSWLGGRPFGPAPRRVGATRWPGSADGPSGLRLDAGGNCASC